MLREKYHPNAFLSNIKNIKRGLKARTSVLTALEKGSADASTIAKGVELHYNVVMHHLKLLMNEGIVVRKGSKPHVWTLTGMGQKRLVGTG
ncbi:MAG TPA: ArsR family transcriptional regulator [Candidatus Bathyarchaeia archaeon]|jgi:predicted transcriptional regulator|nr:ArsR family transcriptional regulator [Candidatus Bathyarchaeia archaeon]